MAKDETPQYDPVRLLAFWEFVAMSKAERRQVRELEKGVRKRKG